MCYYHDCIEHVLSTAFDDHIKLWLITTLDDSENYDYSRLCSMGIEKIQSVEKLNVYATSENV